MFSSVMTAGNFVKISFSSQAELERLFSDPNLTVHHYTNTEVYATATVFDAKTMVMMRMFAGFSPSVFTLLSPTYMTLSFLANRYRSMDRTAVDVSMTGNVLQRILSREPTLQL